MIEPRQIRAARALLNWSQTNLAEASGIAVSSIKNIENSLTVARRDTIEEIKKALERAGVVFTSGGGVQPHRPEVTVFHGTNGFREFLNLIYNDMLNGGEILISGVDERLIKDIAGTDLDAHVKRMSDIKSKITVKCMLREGDKYKVADDYCEYRWISKDYFGAAHFYIFNKKVAIIAVSSREDVIVVVHDIASLAEFYKRLFEKLWADSTAIKDIAA